MKRWAIFAVIIANLLDIYTTMLPGGFEGNSWVRDANLHPILSHLIAVKLGIYLQWGFLTLIAYAQLQKVHQKLADLFVTGACLWSCRDFVEILVGNVVIHLGWVH